MKFPKDGAILHSGYTHLIIPALLNFFASSFCTSHCLVCKILYYSFIQYARAPLSSGLEDKSGYVRRNALMAAVKLFRLDADMFREMDLMEIINRSVHETDPQVCE